MLRNRIIRYISGHRTQLFVVLCLFGLCLAQSHTAPRKQRRRHKTDERVYLQHADMLRFDQFGNTPGAQVLNGHVSFLHKGAHLTCDSAYFYQESNSFKAFGHVRMRQGDTLSLNSDYAWYDGEQEPVKLVRGAGLSTDNLAGVPTYEAILSYAKSQLTQAAFVTLDEQASDCVYVSAQDGECQQDYWVSLDNGLLCKQTMTVSGELVYLMEQTALEIFPDNDEALEGVFCLPDGTEVFTTEA